MSLSHHQMSHQMLMLLAHLLCGFPNQWEIEYVGMGVAGRHVQALMKSVDFLINELTQTARIEITRLNKRVII